MASSLAEKLKTLLESAGASQANASESPDASTMPFGTGSTPQQPPVQNVASDPVVTPTAEPSAQAAQPQAPIPMRSPAGMGGGMQASQKAIQDELRARLTASQDAQQQGVDFDKARLAGLLGVTQPVDLSNGMAAVAMLNPNSAQAQSAAKNYKAQPDDQKEIDAARKQQATSQQSLTADQTNELKAQLQAKMLGQSMADQRMGLMQQRMQENVYGKVVQGLYKDPTLTTAVQNNNAINRTVDSMFKDGQSVSMASLHDLQQTVTNALTAAKGGGGIGEREDRQITTVQNQMEALMQKWGNLDSVPKDDPTLVHFMQVAQAGQGLITDQAKTRMAALVSGHENITGLPTYAPMLENVQGKIAQSLQPAEYYKTHNTLAPGSSQASASSGEDHSAALAWAKNPANQSNPNYGAVMAKLKAAGAL
jgi:hypothetical protein